MQAIEFRTTAIDGIIRIPDEYVKQIGPEIKVVLYSDRKGEAQAKKSPGRSSLMDLAGALKGCDDMDVKEIRAERRKKYENTD